MGSDVFRARLRVLLEALDSDASSGPDDASRVAAILESTGETDQLWLAYAVLRAELPVRETVVEAKRLLRVSGGAAVLDQIGRDGPRGRRGRSREVRVVRGSTVVDVHHTARTGLATGIQRVVRMSIRRWIHKPGVELVGWDADYRSIVQLADGQIDNALNGTQRRASPDRNAVVIVPWRSSYVLPELAIEPDRLARVQALAEFSGNRTAVIGFDCVPLTSAETTARGMGSAFARNLRAVAEMDRVAAISTAAANEYAGWRAMLTSIGLRGPEITPILLPDEIDATPNEESLEATRAVLRPDALPLLLCVGSHEPRKNHLGVLHAAEMLWLRGREFRLVFVGGNAWRSELFMAEFGRLVDEGHPLMTMSKITDEFLSSAYALADATIFPSFNEGFGLPVAESLAAGTPVITSNYGSMKEIAEQGGAVLIDPRADSDIISAIDRTLFDGVTAARARAEARQRRHRTWDEYAAEVWDYFQCD